MEAYSVSKFVEFLNSAMVEAVFPQGACVEGEVVEYRVSQGRWIWFNLKDETSLVSCFATTWQLRTPLAEGMKVRVYGLPRVHPKSGKFSINVERAEPVGEGALKKAFELLKKKLGEEGVFDAARKRAIPRIPERIGLIASGESAAYGDFLRILGNRWGGATVQHIDVAVQGKDAVAEIVGAFKHFNAHPELAEVIVLTRGGGSIEDLQAFNAEDVVRAVFGSTIPVVVAVGHERDETLADYAADVRASTPTNAAELVVPDRRDIAAAVDASVRHMDGALRTTLGDLVATVDSAASRLEAGFRARVDAFRHLARDLSDAFATFAADIRSRSMETSHLSSRLDAASRTWMGRAGERVDGTLRLLKTLDPQRPFERGFALVRAGGKVVTDAATVAAGTMLDVTLRRGVLSAQVAGSSPGATIRPAPKRPKSSKSDGPLLAQLPGI